MTKEKLRHLESCWEATHWELIAALHWEATIPL